MVDNGAAFVALGMVVGALALLAFYPGEILTLLGIIAILIGSVHTAFANDAASRIVDAIGVIGGLGLVGLGAIILRMPEKPKAREPDAQ